MGILWVRSCDEVLCCVPYGVMFVVGMYEELFPSTKRCLVACITYIAADKPLFTISGNLVGLTIDFMGPT